MLQVPDGSWALVTGASSGIGESIARKLAERRIPTLLVARSAGRLRELAADWRARYRADVEALPADLSEPGAAAALVAATEGSGRPVDLLVNAAGFAILAPLAEAPPERTAEMLRLNVLAATELTQRYLAAMRARRRGRILNVASTQAFLPMPHFAVYGASKAYLLSFTRAVAEEAEAYGVTLTALCPGYTRTGFYGVAGMRRPWWTPFPEMAPDDVAEAGLQGLERGARMVVPHPFDRVWVAALRLVPRSWPSAIAGAVMSRSRAPSQDPPASPPPAGPPRP